MGKRGGNSSRGKIKIIFFFSHPKNLSQPMAKKEEKKGEDEGEKA